jgi:6-phosphogluconolactonase
LAGLAISPFAAKGAFALGKKSGPTALLFVGTGTQTGSKGIYAYHFDSGNGGLEALGLAAAAPNPSFIALSHDGKVLFAVNEVELHEGAKTGAVSSYVIDKSAGKLTLINTVPSGGTGPCHLSTDHTGGVLLVANYAGGSAASFQIGPDGHLSEAVSEFHYEAHALGPNQDKDRQEAPHAHRATASPGNRFVLINDLGLDCIHIYRLDPATARLTPNDPAAWKAAAGSGPRALRFHPSGRWAYSVNELAATVDQLGWDESTGTLTLIATSTLLPEGFKGIARASEIVFDSKGNFAYVADRDNDFLATFKVDESTGKLSSPRRSPCGGQIPRHIALDPTERWLLVANQDTNLIAVFRRDARTGQLALNGPTSPVQSPQCLVFA